MSDPTPVRSVDVRGQICPYPIIETRKALKDLRPGETMEVLTDNPETAHETMIHLCTTKNYPFHKTELSPGVWRFLITKSE
jgi:TusA-related sulfurtransferase